MDAIRIALRWLVLTGAALALRAEGESQEDKKRSPIPSAADVKQAEKMIRDLFKEDYAQKGEFEKRVLAMKLLDQAPPHPDQARASRD